MSLSHPSLQQLLQQARSLLQEADRAVEAAHALQAASGMDAKQAHEQLARLGGPPALAKARTRLDALLERREAQVSANSPPSLRPVRAQRAPRMRTNLA